MKRKTRRDRIVAFPIPLVRPVADRPGQVQNSSANGRRRSPQKKIFIIKQVNRLPETNARGRELQRLLIFDDHPESLRLLFRNGADPLNGFSGPPRRVVSWDIIFVSILMVILVIEM